MKGVRLPVIALLTAVTLAYGEAHAQARGPSAEDVLEHGQDIVSPRETLALRSEQARQRAREVEEKEQAELRDPTIRVARIAELDAWLRRLVGRFRIDGRIEQAASIAIDVPGMPSTNAKSTVSGDVTGVADCVSVGASAGVQCIFNATWPTIEVVVPPIGAPLPPSEIIRTFNPAMLLIGLNKDPPRIRALMVNADSLTHIWVGKLNENTMTAPRLNRCLRGRCMQPLQISAEPDSEVVTIVLRAGVRLTLTMYRDPEAKAEKPLKPLKSR